MCHGVRSACSVRRATQAAACWCFRIQTISNVSSVSCNEFWLLVTCRCHWQQGGSFPPQIFEILGFRKLCRNIRYPLAPSLNRPSNRLRILRRMSEFLPLPFSVISHALVTRLRVRAYPMMVGNVSVRLCLKLRGWIFDLGRRSCISVTFTISVQAPNAVGG